MTTAQWFGGALAVATLGGVFLFGHYSAAPAPNAPLTPVKIGAFVGSPNAYFPLFVAERKGFFAEQGLEVEIVEMNPGVSVAALTNHEVDYAQYLKEAVTGALKGAEVKVVATYTAEPTFAIVGNPALELNQIKTVGFEFRQSALHYHTLKWAADEDLPVEVVIASPIALLASGQADAAIVNLGQAYQLEQEGYKVFELVRSNVSTGFTTLTETIEQKPEQVAGVIRAREAAMAFIRSNPAEAKELLLESLRLDLNDENRAVADKIYAAIAAPLPEVPVEQSVEELIKFSKAGAFESYAEIMNQTVSQEEVDKAFDLRFITPYAGDE